MDKIRIICLNKLVLTSLMVVFSCSVLFSQKKPSNQDSLKLYKKIEDLSNKTGFTKLIYPLIFNPAQQSAQQVDQKKNFKNPNRLNYNLLEGKTIRKIKIESYGPFEYLIQDTIQAWQSFLTYPGNILHAKSRRFTILNLLLFKEGSSFDSLSVRESERLVRSQSYISDVNITVKTLSNQSDSVDLVIRTFDKWSLIPDFSISNSNIEIGLDEKNFFGLGHVFRNSISWLQPSGILSYKTGYYIPNFNNSYINASIFLEEEENKYYNRGISFQRPFYSPLAKWAAGINISEQTKEDSINYFENGFKLVSYGINFQEYWIGRAYKIFNDNSEIDRTTNLILAGQYNQTKYFNILNKANDSLNIISNENLLLFDVRISNRNYVRDRYIFSYGINEDVPVGKTYKLSLGIRQKNNINRLYFGFLYSKGYYNSLGYLSYSVAFGTFIHNHKFEQGALIGKLNYFTDLFEIRRWRFRQFLKPQITIGLNRNPYDRVTLYGNNGIEGFKDQSVSGKDRMVLNLQTQIYAPWNLIGFRFGPFINCSFGTIGNFAKMFPENHYYARLGLGFLIRNENLVFNNFQFSLSFFTSVSSGVQDLFEFNSFKSSDIGFGEFETGKPTLINYR